MIRTLQFPPNNHPCLDLLFPEEDLGDLGGRDGWGGLLVGGPTVGWEVTYVDWEIRLMKKRANKEKRRLRGGGGGGGGGGYTTISK